MTAAGRCWPHKRVVGDCTTPMISLSTEVGYRCRKASLTGLWLVLVDGGAVCDDRLRGRDVRVERQRFMDTVDRLPPGTQAAASSTVAVVEARGRQCQAGRRRRWPESLVMVKPYRGI